MIAILQVLDLSPVHSSFPFVLSAGYCCAPWWYRADSRGKILVFVISTCAVS